MGKGRCIKSNAGRDGYRGYPATGRYPYSPTPRGGGCRKCLVGSSSSSSSPSPYTLVLGRMVFLYQGYRAYFPRADLSQFGPAQVSGSESNCRNGLQFLPNYEQGLLASLPAGVMDQFLQGGCQPGTPQNLQLNELHPPPIRDPSRARTADLRTRRAKCFGVFSAPRNTFPRQLGGVYKNISSGRCPLPRGP